jgi:hypothetical protein
LNERKKGRRLTNVNHERYLLDVKALAATRLHTPASVVASLAANFFIFRRQTFSQRNSSDDVV